jgi:signal transduction histidine kinase
MTARRADLITGIGGAVGAAVLCLLWSGSGFGFEVGPLPLAAAIGSGGALGLARSYPRATALAVGGLLLAAAPAGEPVGGDAFVVMPLVAAHAFCAARFQDRVWSVISLVILMAASITNGAVAHDAIVPYIMFTPAAWAAGRVLRERELVAAQLEERARELEEEREAYAELSVRYERARIASELHDIVAHAISVMVVQASAGQRLISDDPASTAETFDAIAGAARQAEEDMGRLVALLGEDGAIGEPPDLAVLEEIVARAAGSGLDVTLRLEGERDGLPADVVRVACRVVQEGLTNALRYAAGSAVTVLVRGGRDALEVEVVNGPAPVERALRGTGTGHGLRGLREGAGAVGGTLEGEPASGGGWRLVARLPRRATAAR